MFCNEASWLQTIESADAADRVCLEHVMIDLILFCRNDFKTMIVDHLVASYPSRLYLLIGQKPCVPCDTRRVLGQELLSGKSTLCPSNHNILDVNALKLSHLFRSDVVQMVETGLCSTQLFGTVYAMARMHKTGSQEVEGINSNVKLQGERAPHISLELLSSRLVISRAMSIDKCSRTQFKWRNNISNSLKLLATVRENSHEGGLLRSAIDRWAVPVAIDLLHDAIKTDGPCVWPAAFAQAPVAGDWAKAMSCIIRKTLTLTSCTSKLPNMLIPIGTDDATILIPFRSKPDKSFAVGRMVTDVEVECSFQMQTFADALQQFHDVVDQLSHT